MAPAGDVLEKWRRIRRALSPVARVVRGGVEGASPWRVLEQFRQDAFVEASERGEARAQAMLRAIALASSTPGPLTLAQLVTWQRAVLDRDDVTVRDTDAFAKGGRERMGPLDHSELDRALAEAGSGDVDVVVDAARAYGDVLFFHPFADGNARLGRLVMAWTLAARGAHVTKLDAVWRTPWSPQTAVMLVRTLAACVVVDN